jgi:hypothetical protein
MGISFMLTVTLTVLQLREVVHPEILARVIRPQEGHADLLQSLKFEPMHTHVRRTVVSMAVYELILGLFVWVPVQACRALGGGGVFPLQIRLMYILPPEIQLPLELSLGHIAFLTVLERKKDLIGQIEHAWFKLVSKWLGISRFVLPYGQSITADGEAVLEPMKRPASNWDAHLDQSVSRWAWGDEPLSELEQGVAPRVIPDHWAVRSLLLILLSWVAVVLIVLALVFLPLFLGKAIWYAFQIPIWMYHDPMQYLVGMFILVVAYLSCKPLYTDPSLSNILRNMASMPMKTWKLFLLIVSDYFLSCLGVAIIVNYAKQLAAPDVIEKAILRDLILGFALVTTGIYAFESAFLELVFHNLQIPLPPSEWSIKETFTLLYNGFLSGDSDAVDDCLRTLRTKLSWPVMQNTLFRGAGPAVVGSMSLSFTIHTVLTIVTGTCRASLDNLTVDPKICIIKFVCN